MNTMTIRHYRYAGRRITAVGGDIGPEQAPGLRRGLFLALTGVAEDLVIDTRGVTTMTPAGLAVLIGCRGRIQARGKSLVLVDERGPVSASLTRVGLFPAFAVRATVEDAVRLTERPPTAERDRGSSWRASPPRTGSVAR